ncbi:MAG: hypothetical protein KC468_07055 [Myxococcales bacterium]|nr:hypothetical protein [Myxococcales bacterium]
MHAEEEERAVSLVPLFVVAGVCLFVLAASALALLSLYTKVEQGTALIINKLNAEPEVTFTGGFVLPIIHRAERLDISVKIIDVDRRGSTGLICRDNIRADITARFFVRVGATREDVLKVARTLGCARASDHATLVELFASKFSEALKTVGKQFEFEQLYSDRDQLKDRLLEQIGLDLDGFRLDDAVIDFLEQTPLGQLDRQNILDAQGILKIQRTLELTGRVDALTSQRDRLRQELDALQREHAALVKTLTATRERINAPDFSYTAIDELRALLG